MFLPTTVIHKVFATEAEAAALLVKMEAEEDDCFAYKIIPDPLGTGKAIIKVYDKDDGAFLGNL